MNKVQGERTNITNHEYFKTTQLTVFAISPSHTKTQNIKRSTSICKWELGTLSYMNEEYPNNYKRFNGNNKR